jgi:hypothetical protein
LLGDGDCEGFPTHDSPLTNVLRNGIDTQRVTAEVVRHIERAVFGDSGGDHWRTDTRSLTAISLLQGRTQAMTETLVPFTVADGWKRHARYAERVSSAPVHCIVLPTTSRLG